MSDDVGERRIFDAVKRILLRESLNQPLMVLFEDLHWIDDHTQRFLNVLADSIGTTRLLLMVNYRPEYSHQWNSKTYYTQVRLDPLGIANAEEMLAALLGAGDDLVPLKRLIVARSDYFRRYVDSKELGFAVPVLNSALRHAVESPQDDRSLDVSAGMLICRKLLRVPEDSWSGRARAALIRRQNADGSWGSASSSPKNKFHLTFVSIVANLEFPPELGG